MSETNTLEQAVEHVLELAKKQGAQADVIASSSESFSLKSDQGELSEYKVTASQVIGVRVIKDEHIAISYSESLEPENLSQMVNQALTNASFTKKDPYQKIRSEGLILRTEYPEIFQQDSATPEQKIELALSLESRIREKPLAKSAPYNGYSENSATVLLGNTLGTRCSHQERTFSCYTAALIDHNDKQAMHVAASIARTFDGLSPDKIINDAYEMADALLEGEPIATGQYSVIFEQDSLNDVLGAFGSCFSGESAKRGTNPWRDKVGEQVMSPLLTFKDVAYMPGGFSIKAFDGEGFATADTPLIENGTLVGLLHNSATSAHFGVAHTANAGRSAKGTLSVSSRHDVISAGTSSEAEVTAGEYLELVELQGVHSGADSISGEFSFGASGFLCRDGKRLKPVRGITVAGNFYTMIKEVEAVGSTVMPNYDGCFFAPLIRFARLNIAGK
ncbi:Zn-dependent protease [Enterovibrio norvegicus FF-33]|uniref:Zn-dependent protease n=1 Tax=Enterovibrio norvegicus FF-454 TaxID=1185651 RepID=A0A1E5CBK0_9GAMM|nr:TldD/PmbA family protein [Enterovibrio norvegicus]OEE62869.1 Zn-dependent protease [Enterovibrio norvegicus FF-454]OEE66793.1 Zn-dependent protease [Enterovibrio norvegicus FF-33]OEE76570.1 Zn-dependent protease [Enterovibrio norvegicus FF-162]